jgi:hypothetical protein
MGQPAIRFLPFIHSVQVTDKGRYYLRSPAIIGAKKRFIGVKERKAGKAPTK